MTAKGGMVRTLREAIIGMRRPTSASNLSWLSGPFHWDITVLFPNDIENRFDFKAKRGLLVEYLECLACCASFMGVPLRRSFLENRCRRLVGQDDNESWPRPNTYRGS